MPISVGEPFRLDARTALVTGASRGIGAAAARALDRAGARVVLVARDRTRLEQVAASLAHPEAPAAPTVEALNAVGTVDILINNAAVAHRSSVLDITPALIDRLLAVNVRAPLLLIAALVPSMIDSGGGAIHRRRDPLPGRRAGTGRHPSQCGRPRVVDTDLWAKNKAIPGVVEQITGETTCVDGGMARTLDLYGGPV